VGQWGGGRGGDGGWGEGGGVTVGTVMRAAGWHASLLQVEGAQGKMGHRINELVGQ